MHAPMPQDAPDPFRPGWAPLSPVPAALPPYTVPPQPAYGQTGAGPYSPPLPYPLAQRTCGEATASLVCGLAGWLILPLICPILAIIFGIRAKRQIRAASGALSGGGMATAGIILGALHLALTVIIGVVVLLAFVFLVAGFAAGMAVHGL